jgi:hypothetical protein
VFLLVLCFQDIITVDAIIQSEDAHMELCRALRVSKMTNAKLRLRLGKLDISCLGVPRIVVLLEQLEKEVCGSLEFMRAVNCYCFQLVCQL